MFLEFAFPHQLRKAKEENWPLLIPAGTVEYHGEHLSAGCDTLLVTAVLAELQEKVNCVVAPPIWYGPASFAVAGPEKGTIDVDVDRFERHVRDILRGYLESGFHNIYVVIHHQFEQGILMPMALAFLKSGKMLAFEFMEKSRGRGWWGDDSFADYYDNLQTAHDPFNWVKVIPLMSPAIQTQTGYDHAGKYETSFLMAVCPKAVDLELLSDDGPWFVQAAREASAELGQAIMQLVLEYLAEVLKG